MKINKPKIAVISDIHAGVHQNSSIWHDIMINWSDWFKSQCEEQQIEDIVICGDLFHDRNELNINTLQVTSKMLENWKQFNIIILIGNHDSYYKERSDVHSLEMLKHWDNITIIDTPYQDTFFGKKIGFCPWAANLKSFDKCDILFGHLEIQGFNITKEKVCEHGEQLINLLDVSPLVISGHFHIRDEKKFDKGTILYTGCAYELYWGDYSTPKGYHILDLKTSHYTFHENPVSPKHVKLPVSDIKKKLSVEKIKKIVHNNWVKIIVDEQVDVNNLLKIIDKLKVYKPIDIKTDFTESTTEENEVVDINLSGVDISESIHEYIENIEIPHKSLVENYILELYRKVA